MFGSERCAERRDNIFNARAEQAYGVHVAFDDDNFARRTYRTIGFVKPEKQVAFVEERSFRGVQIFWRIVGRINHSTAETDDASENVSDWNHHAGAKSVVVAGRIFPLDNQSDRLKLLRSEILSREPVENIFPFIGRETEFERFNRLLRNSTRRKIFPADFAASRLD